MSQTQEQVLVSSRFYPPAFLGGGPPRSVGALVSQTSHEFNFKVVASSHDLGQEQPMGGLQSNRWTEQQDAEVFYAGAGTPSLADWRKLIRTASPDLVYLNSVFDLRYSLFPLLALAVDASRPPVLIAPRGELMDGAMMKSPVRKRLYLSGIRLLMRRLDVTWHASSLDEKKSIEQAICPAANIEVAMNLWEAEAPKAAEPLGPSRNNTRTRLVFLSRVAPKKNLLRAVQSLSDVEAACELVVAGPIDDSDYWRLVTEAAAQLPSHVEFSYAGSIGRAGLHPFLATFDALLLPTFGENFGHAILESLSAGLPVVVGPETPFSVHADRYSCVRVADPNDTGDISTKVTELINSIATNRSDLVSQARQLIAREFDPTAAVDDTIQAFRKAIDRQE